MDESKSLYTKSIYKDTKDTKDLTIHSNSIQEINTIIRKSKSPDNANNNLIINKKNKVSIFFKKIEYSVRSLKNVVNSMLKEVMDKDDFSKEMNRILEEIKSLEEVSCYNSYN